MKCWEFMRCGRGQEGGCPAWPDNGSICAEVVGTFCADKDRILGINALKLEGCTRCAFFNSIHYMGNRELESTL